MDLELLDVFFAEEEFLLEYFNLLLERVWLGKMLWFESLYLGVELLLDIGFFLLVTRFQGLLLSAELFFDFSSFLLVLLFHRGNFILKVLGSSIKLFLSFSSF